MGDKTGFLRLGHIAILWEAIATYAGLELLGELSLKSFFNYNWTTFKLCNMPTLTGRMSLLA